jgi:SAM-dependent methyltransferase/methyltransferase-like protein
MQTIYDDLPYPGTPYSQTHPDRLATLATLFGMTPAPVDRCRVLELGCGDGGNLIPMAFGLPESRFTGVDLAGSAIARGQQLIGQLALANIRIEHLDLMELGAAFGEYDYIIAHGLYSWVPPQVRERILEICKSRLAPQGVAFISYNAYPGGHLRDAIREMMRFHTRPATGAREQVRQARELLEFLVEAHPEQDAYSVFLRSELQSFLERKPEHFYHDELAEHNHRFYFHEFVRDAARQGLQFLSEARLLSMQSGAFPPEVIARIGAFSQNDDLVRQQYLDFLKLRTFRQSLLCHAGIRLEPAADPALVRTMFAAAEAQPASSDPDICSTSAEEFKYPSGGNMSTNHPLAKASMLHLGRLWPNAISFPELLRIARTLGGRNTAPLEEDAAWLSDMILRLYAANFLELHQYEPAFAGEPSERPVASLLARVQVQTSSSVTTLRHSSIEIADEAARQLLLMLDGTRNREQLRLELGALAVNEVTSEQLERNLQTLAKRALLVA